MGYRKRTEANLRRAEELLQQNKSWAEIGDALGLDKKTVRCWFDEGFRQRRIHPRCVLSRRQVNVVKQRLDRDAAERLKEIPPDTRTEIERLLGDPPPGRSALDRMRGRAA
jgi:hypothetical protein